MIENFRDNGEKRWWVEQIELIIVMPRGIETKLTGVDE